jgi:hypothetical protein
MQIFSAPRHGTSSLYRQSLNCETYVFSPILVRRTQIPGVDDVPVLTSVTITQSNEVGRLVEGEIIRDLLALVESAALPSPANNSEAKLAYRDYS